MRVVITEGAWSDMLSIGRNIKNDSPSRASAFVDQLYDRCQSLGAMPHAFALVPGHERQDIRRCVHGNYLIFYRVGDETVEIIHILHGAMDYERILFPPE